MPRGVRRETASGMGDRARGEAAVRRIIRAVIKKPERADGRAILTVFWCLDVNSECEFGAGRCMKDRGAWETLSRIDIGRHGITNPFVEHVIPRLLKPVSVSSN